jgi:pimeloyl-ACP methyl ester carboxylesterase
MMAVNLRGVTVVLLAGTGSDDDYAYRAFSSPLHDVGAIVRAPVPEPSRLVSGYLHALDDAARLGPIAVGGISIGAAVAAAVLAGLPAWTGPPGSAMAALAAQYSASVLRRDGLAAAISQMRASSPPWLGAELTRSWVGQWPELPDAMEAAAGYVAPTCQELETLAVPMGIAAATDDPVHPVEVAIEWAAAAPMAGLRTFTLDELGADPGVLGAACVTALMAL